ncbi:MAG TPA: helix-turn-helix domain-containing protein [Bryobacteraceae bacterium]|nr:helix-turn-helix domain-containing protein [Bryobacteraceae bacterium]
MMLLAIPSPRNDASVSAEVHHQCDARSAALILSQLERILHSSQFHGSELLRNLLSYLTKRAIERPGEAVKEYDLAVDVLGRDPAFDPRMDSAVRVHTARLRAKLAEYYLAEGADDPFVIEVPKGACVICWRHLNEHSDEVFHEASAPIPIAPVKRTLHWRSFAAGGAAAVLAGCLVWVVLALSSPGVPAPVQTFWRPFLGSVPDPIVAFSNHRFVGTSASGLHAYQEGVDSPSGMNDTYSGTGTVMAVHELNSMFARFHRTIRLKRAELLTWDDARTTNLILIGSPESNSRLRQIPPLEYFDFKSSRAEPRLGVGGIVNLHPKPGEESIYYGSGIPFTSDYAVIAMLAGLKPGQRILVLAGTNTYGVQAAAEFICRADLVGGLLSRLSITRGDSIPDFEALMAVKVNGGVPVDSQLVMVRLRQ